MVTFSEPKAISLGDLVIDTAQVRTRRTSKELDELVDSIDRQGLLQPILVCPAGEPGKYSIVTGQRRFLACMQLQHPTISAVVLSERVSEIDAKVLSLTENLVRTDLSSSDLIDVCTYLYKRYGSVKAVSQETGLSAAKVSNYVKYDRLATPLKELVDSGHVDVKTALRAQDAATTDGQVDPDEAVKLAEEMSPMSGVQQQKIVKDMRSNPELSADDAIEDAKSGGRITQVVVTLSSDVHAALGKYAESEDVRQDDAAADLIHQGLYLNDFITEPQH